MTLRNKKTGEIGEIRYENHELYVDTDEGFTYWLRTIAELNEKWEDVEDTNVPNIPLIKDEKIRKIVRALFDVWGVEDVKIDSNKYFLVTTIEAIGKGWKLEIPNININGVFKPTELCGEEEE